MKTFIALIATCLVAATAMAADIEAALIFQMRLVAETPSATSEPMVKISKSNDQIVKETVNVEKAVLIDQKALKSAWVGKDSLGHPTIEITFNKKGTEQFATVTEQNLGKRLAVLVDGRLFEAPMIKATI